MDELGVGGIVGVVGGCGDNARDGSAVSIRRRGWERIFPVVAEIIMKKDQSFIHSHTQEKKKKKK